MLSKELIIIYERDLAKLKEEIGAYSDESKIWIVQPGISNSAGNLCLHLIGNLNHFIGATLGNTGYVRNRDNEFAAKNIPRAQLIKEVEQTSEMVKSVIGKLTEGDMAMIYPIKYRPEEVSTAFTLVHMLVHLNYHLGQINYHRRLLG